MTNAEFLDDLAQREVAGGVFTEEETLRLWELGGYRVPPADVRQKYMLTSPGYHVRHARKRLIELGTERIKEAV